MSPRFSFESTGAEVVSAFKDQVHNRIFVITGPSAGSIGAETAISLAAGSPNQLILISRNLSRVQPVIDTINSTHPSCRVSFIQCDLSSQHSVRSAATEISSQVPHIDVLINNAAVPAGPFSKTEDGIESQFGTNHIGHFLLTNLLMPKILAAAAAAKSSGAGEGSGARIVNVSSSAHRYATHSFKGGYYDYNFSDGQTYSEREGYFQSKAANILFTRSLAAKLATPSDHHHGVEAFSLHPGSIDSGMQAHVSKEAMAEALRKRKEEVERRGGEFTRAKKKTVQQGCATTLVAALDPGLVEGGRWSGAYLEDGVVCERLLEGIVKDESGEEAGGLWELSERLVGEKFDWV